MHLAVIILIAFLKKNSLICLRLAEKAADLRQKLKMSYNDALIAAAALCKKLTLATRNVADSEKTEVTVVDPWNYPES